MARAWTNTRDYSLLAQYLGSLDEQDFRLYVRTLLQLVYTGDPRHEADIQSFGRLLRFTGFGGRSWLVSCHYFSTESGRLGDEEVAEMSANMHVFFRDGSKVDHWLFVHNRDPRSSSFRAGADDLLESLRKSDLVDDAKIWDLRSLLVAAFEAMAEFLVKRAGETSLSYLPLHQGAGTSFPPLEQVPLAWSELVADQHELRSVSPPEKRVADPSALLRERTGRNRTLLLGEFGFGKTTAAWRAYTEGESYHVFLVPGARIGKEVKSSKDFLNRCLDVDRLFEGVNSEWLDLYRRLLRPAVEAFFWEEGPAGLLIIDGLDECPFLDEEGGLQKLFNALWSVGVPVVMTMRTEYWRRHETSFAMAFGLEASHGERRFHHIGCLELLAWETPQTEEFLRRYRSSLDDSLRQERLRELEASVRNGSFEDLYGDVPKRPLFLRFIADTVMREGLPRERQGRARVLRDGVRFKILRDIQAPQVAGGEGRPKVHADRQSPEDVVALAWEAMVSAAQAMVTERDGHIELQPDCRWDEVQAIGPRLHNIDDPGVLSLHSLLLPPTLYRGFSAQRVAFAHRTYQEFFLAWGLLEKGYTGDSTLPSSVVDWMQDLRAEGLVEAAPGLTIRRFTSEASAPDLKLTIEVDRNVGSQLVYRLDAPLNPDLGLNEREFTKDVGTSIENFLRDDLNDVEYMGRRSSDNAEDLTRHMKTMGAKLSDRLLTPELLQILWNLRSEKLTLLIQSDIPWIPWELLRLGRTENGLYKGGPFLAEAFAVTKWKKGVDLKIRLPWSRVALVVPRNEELPATKEERAYLLSLGRAPERSVEDVEARKVSLLQQLEKGEFDGIHFAGHGNFDYKDADRNFLSLEEEDTLQPADLYAEAANMGAAQPFVFFNACRTVREGYTLGGLGGWPERFIEIGVAGFLGAYWQVPDCLAKRFAELFYQGFLAGRPLGKAVQEARLGLRDLSGGHPAYLAYSVFGHPLARCTMVLQGQSKKRADGKPKSKSPFPSGERGEDRPG